MLNYAVDPAVLAPLVPRGVELDLWQDGAVVSMVGFLFRNTRMLGCAVPFHRDFEEVNLRFYVRRRVGTEWRRGVTFVREIVPRRAIAWTARALYNEPYLALPMRHTHGVTDDARTFEYAWQFERKWHALGAEVEGEPHALRPGSEEEFIFEHYWGYTAQRDRGTVEYEVEHPRWRTWTAKKSWLRGDTVPLYGSAFSKALAAEPRSAFVAEGSPVVVRGAQRIA